MRLRNRLRDSSATCNGLFGLLYKSRSSWSTDKRKALLSSLQVPLLVLTGFWPFMAHFGLGGTFHKLNDLKENNNFQNPLQTIMAFAGLLYL